MAIINNEGIKISFNCSELIEELKKDILEFGGEKEVAVWCKKYKGVTLCTNYDFIEEEKPITKEEINKNEYIKIMTMAKLLYRLEKQNSPI